MPRDEPQLPQVDTSVDLKTVAIDEVFQVLNCSRSGLSSAEAERRLLQMGPNKLEEIKESEIKKFLLFMWNPLSWVMEAAAVVAIVLDNGDHQPPDWQDFVGIIMLLLINATISYFEERHAGKAANDIMKQLAARAHVLRDGQFQVMLICLHLTAFLSTTKPFLFHWADTWVQQNKSILVIRHPNWK